MSPTTPSEAVLPVVAWEIYEHRIYGAPGEKHRRVLWVETFRREDGSTTDLDWLLDAARDRGIDPGARTIHVKSLCYASDLATQIAELTRERDALRERLQDFALQALVDDAQEMGMYDATLAARKDTE